MKYIIVFDPYTESAILQDGATYNIEEFDTLQEAIEIAEEWKQAGDCESYKIYQSLPDELDVISDLERFKKMQDEK